MIIGLHANQLDSRGNGTVICDYALALRDLGHTPLIISSKESIHMERFSDFDTTLYDKVEDLTQIIDDRKIEVLYMSRFGNPEEFTPTNCKTAIHAIFDMRVSFGTVFAGVSEWLAKCFSSTSWVPHIVNPPRTNETLHDELGIPKDAFILGRHGGYDQFNLEFVHPKIYQSLDERSDLWYIFLNTRPFIDHPRVRFLNFNPDLLYRSKFINTCDAMIHARRDGETFGLAVAEFSFFNKPVITYDATYWQYMSAHLDMLGDKAVTYKNEDELLTCLTSIDKAFIKDKNWDCYSIKYSPQNVIKQFSDVFLKEKSE